MLTFHWQDIVFNLPLLLTGLLYTIILSGTAFVFALLLGTILGVLRHEGPVPLKKLATLYIELIRGIPLILFLVFIHYGLLPLVIDRPNFFISSVLAFTLFEAAYIAEIIRSGFRSITQTERDSAVSLGLSYNQQLFYIYLPLAFSRTMPAMVSQLITLIKDTSLASIVGVIELTRAGEIIYERTFHDFEILIFQALIYFLMCYGLSKYSQRFEAKRSAQRNQEEKLFLESLQT